MNEVTRPCCVSTDNSQHDASCPRAQPKDYDHVGYLINGRWICKDCPKPTEELTCKVYYINIRPYSQQCARCRRLIVDGWKTSKDGVSPLNLFDGRWLEEEVS
jgi:hypothetical protein